MWELKKYKIYAFNSHKIVIKVIKKAVKTDVRAEKSSHKNVMLAPSGSEFSLPSNN